MTEFIKDRRQQNRCPIETCKSTFIVLIFDPLPKGDKLMKKCTVCGHKFIAQREQDHMDFKKQAVEFNQ